MTNDSKLKIVFLYHSGIEEFFGVFNSYELIETSLQQTFPESFKSLTTTFKFDGIPYTVVIKESILNKAYG